MGMDGRYQDPGFKAGAVVEGGHKVGDEMPGAADEHALRHAGADGYGAFINESG
jgi:hypothetical protein